MNGFDVQTHAGEQMVNITDQLCKAVKDAAMADGVVTAFTPHTSCGLTITEAATPRWRRNLLRQLDTLGPPASPTTGMRRQRGRAHQNGDCRLVAPFIVKGGGGAARTLAGRLPVRVRRPADPPRLDPVIATDGPRRRSKARKHNGVAHYRAMRVRTYSSSVIAHARCKV